MMTHKRVAGLLIAIIITVALFWPHLGIMSALVGDDWSVTDKGILIYSAEQPKYSLSLLENSSNTSLFGVSFQSRDAQIAGLLRIPAPARNGDARNTSVPGIVLLPGATVTKEREQGLAKHLADLGYASITLDQRNLGVTNIEGDLQMFLGGLEPIEHRMVHDSLAAAEVLRSLPGIHPDRIIYAGESNGGRIAIIACSMDERSRGVLAISTCGYGIDKAVSQGLLKDPMQIRFYRSIDPETYLLKIPPKSLVMIHSLNDTVIPCEYANQTFGKAMMPKSLHIVGCQTHGYCKNMDEYVEEDLERMAS